MKVTSYKFKSSMLSTNFIISL